MWMNVYPYAGCRRTSNSNSRWRKCLWENLQLLKLNFFPPIWLYPLLVVFLYAPAKQTRPSMCQEGIQQCPNWTFHLTLLVLMLPAGQFSKHLIILCVSAGATASQEKTGVVSKQQPGGGQGAGCVQNLVNVSHHNTVRNTVIHIYCFDQLWMKGIFRHRHFWSSHSHIMLIPILPAIYKFKKSFPTCLRPKPDAPASLKQNYALINHCLETIFYFGDFLFVVVVQISCFKLPQ